MNEPFYVKVHYEYCCTYCDNIQVDAIVENIPLGGVRPWPHLPRGWRVVEGVSVCPEHQVEITPKKVKEHDHFPRPPQGGFMPIHFQDFQGFLDLVTNSRVAEVIVSQKDFNFLWDRVTPSRRHKDHLYITNGFGDLVKVRLKITGTLDLTGDKIEIVETA